MNIKIIYFLILLILTFYFAFISLGSFNLIRRKSNYKEKLDLIKITVKLDIYHLIFNLITNIIFINLFIQNSIINKSIFYIYLLFNLLLALNLIIYSFIKKDIKKRPIQVSFIRLFQHSLYLKINQLNLQ